MKYSLSVPFMQRILNLAVDAGFTGQITANSFMKRQFGKKLVEDWLPQIDLTHVIDTAGAYIPGHGTPTVILFGRNRAPVSPTIRLVMGIKGEPSTPPDPATGVVWSAILNQVDRAGSESEYISVEDTSRETLSHHPWSIGGGGAAELKELMDAEGTTLRHLIDRTGIVAVTGEDEAYVEDPAVLRRKRVSSTLPFVEGDMLRDWHLRDIVAAIFPYNPKTLEPQLEPSAERVLWPYRTNLRNRVWFRKTHDNRGLAWFEYAMFADNLFEVAQSIAFGSVSTHNHFVFDDGGKLFKQSSPVIKLSTSDKSANTYGLLGLLNSAPVCFWMKQVFHNKGSTVDQHGARQRTDPFEDFYDIDSTKLKNLPIPDQHPSELGSRLNDLGLQLVHALSISSKDVPSREMIAAKRQSITGLIEAMIANQEELDWECYELYGIIDKAPRYHNPPPIKLGQRAFEIALARGMAAGTEVSSWFTRHSSIPITDIPSEWPEEYKQVVEKRIALIQSDRNIGLIERPEYKRRWNIDPWDHWIDKALREWLLIRLESYFDLDGRMHDEKTITAKKAFTEARLTTVAEVTDLARQDRDFMQVAELYAGRMDFDVTNLIGVLIESESVPVLPVLLYKNAGIDKRAVWERTWELQRTEDAISSLFQVDRLVDIGSSKPEKGLRHLVAALNISEDAKTRVLSEATSAAEEVTRASKEGRSIHGELILTPTLDAAKRARQSAIGDIPVPPKYTSADFLTANTWRLRGKLDAPKERWVSFPHCEGHDPSLVIAWAGYDHLQLARAIAERYEHAKEHEGRKLIPLLACIGHLVPWLKQWHNDLDPKYGERMGDYFDKYLAEEAKAVGMTVSQIMAWTPPEQPRRRGGRRRETPAVEA
jgi:hypothetical protein